MKTALLHKYIIGEATEAEQKEVIECINESPEHLHQYTTLRRLHDLTLWNISPQIEEHKNQRHIPWRKITDKVLKIAAIIALLFLGNYYWWNKQKETETTQSIYVPAGQRAELTLADGTKVWLNSQSKLTYPGIFNGKYRSVRLDGEGYFAVKADKDHPFIVKTKCYDVRVLGTEFNITAYTSDNSWHTSLLTGKVKITGKNTCMELTPNTQAYLHDGKLIKQLIENRDYFRWREGLICFNNISLEDMIKKLELYYNIKIIVNNHHILNNHYTGKFRTEDGIEHVLRVLKLKNHFTYTKDDINNIITIN